MDAEYEVGGRYLSSSHHPLTLRYIGPLPPPAAPGQTYFGVEYDDPAHGLHSGTVGEGDGQTRIFPAPRQPGSCSFLKVRPGKPALQLGPTFWECLKERYLFCEAVKAQQETEIVLGSSGGNIRVSAPNLSKVHSRLTDLSSLKSIGLEGQWVSGVGSPPEGTDDAMELSNLQSLNLAENLLPSLDHLAPILRLAPKLRTLTLNHSRFPLTPPPELPGFKDLQELHLRSSLLTYASLIQLLPSLPALQVLDVGCNPLELEQFRRLGNKEEVSEARVQWHTVRELNIEECGVLEWMDLTVLGSFGSLDQLNISSNPFSSIPFPPPSAISTGPRPPNLPPISSLVLLHSRITDWECVDNLSLWFGAIRRLKIGFAGGGSSKEESSRGPKTEGTSKDRAFLIAKFPGLEVLNSTAITAEERRDSERYYLSEAERAGMAGVEGRGWGRVRELREKHGDEAAEPGEKPVMKAAPVAASGLGGSSLRSKMINITVVPPSASPVDRFTLPLLPSSPLSLFLLKLSRKLSLPADDLRLFRPVGADCAEAEDDVEDGAIEVDLTDLTSTVDWAGLVDGDIVVVRTR